MFIPGYVKTVLKRMASLKMHDFALSGNHGKYQMNQEAVCNVLPVHLCVSDRVVEQWQPLHPPHLGPPYPH